MKSIQLLEMLEELDYGRRDFRKVVAMGLAAAKAGVFGSNSAPRHEPELVGVTLALTPSLSPREREQPVAAF